MMVLYKVGSPLTQAEIVDSEAFELLVATHEALRHLTFLSFDRLHFLILKYEL